MSRRTPKTETEWLNGTHPQPMLKILHHRASERKRRLFAAACCRRVWRLLGDERSRLAVAAAERYADGKATEEELSRAEREADEAHGVARDAGLEGALWAATAVYVTVCGGVGWDPAGRAASAAAEAVGAAEATGRRKTARQEEAAAQLAILRCIFGNPFRPVSVDPGWLAWNAGTIPAVAQRIHDERAFERLPILADALEDAGCTNEDVLTHCRQPGVHARGCWVLDLLLGKE
jgi:hypothetical protein